jgi:hypothetical protein
MSNNEVMAQAVKSFHGEEGPKSPASAPFAVSRTRFADLAANGLVVDVSGAESTDEAAVLSGQATESAGAETAEPAGETAAQRPARAVRNKQ